MDADAWEKQMLLALRSFVGVWKNRTASAEISSGLTYTDYTTSGGPLSP